MTESKLYKVQIERTITKLYTACVDVWASSEEAAKDVAHDRAANKYIKGWHYVPGCEADEIEYHYYVDLPELESVTNVKES
jgi:hypothetical protein